MPKISIFMSSYNYEDFLPQAIDSVLNQTFGDFELYILDDASSDNSWQIIQSYSDPRIKSHRNQKNQNSKSGMNKFIFEIAQGEYIAVHHSDNLWEPDKLEKQYRFLEGHNDIGAVFTNVNVIDENGNPLKDKTHFYYDIFDQPNRSKYEWLNYFFYHMNALCHPSVLIRKKCYADCGGYRNGLAQLPDLDMWVRLCMLYEIHILPQKLVSYRVPFNENFTSGNKPKARKRSRYEFRHILENYRKIPNFDELVKIFPDAEQFQQAEGFDIDYILAMIALEANKQKKIMTMFALDLLFEAINDPQKANKIKSLYHFKHKDFIALTAGYDSFSLEIIAQLNKKIANKDRIINQKSSLIKPILPSSSQDTISHGNHMQNRKGKISQAFRRILQIFRNFHNTRQNLDLIRTSELFDKSWYLAHNPDVTSSTMDPCKHYLLHGGFEGRDPGPDFNSQWYIEKFADVRHAQLNPLLHYIKFGKAEGRSILPSSE